MSRTCLRVRASFGSFQISRVQIIWVAGEVQRRGRVRYVQPSPGLGNGLGACVIGARLGAVICIGSDGLDRGGRFDKARKRATSPPFLPISRIWARWRSYFSCAAINWGSSSRKTARIDSRCWVHVPRWARMMPRKSSPSGGIGLQLVAMKWKIRRANMPNPAAGKVNASGCCVSMSIAKAGRRRGVGLFVMSRK